MASRRTTRRPVAWWISAAEISISTAACGGVHASLFVRSRGTRLERRRAGVRDRRADRVRLHRLLQAARERGPYVLFGASIGGIYIRAYQRTYPGDVAVLVFTNSAGRVGLVTKSVGSLPVVVISSGPIASKTERASRDTASAQLDFLSSNILHIEATGSGHEIHLFQPERVIEGISRAVLALRRSAPLVAR